LSTTLLKQTIKKSAIKVKGIAKIALKAFMDYAWPGNIRELANAIEHAFVLCSGRQIDLSDLPIEIREPKIMSKTVEQESTFDNKKSSQQLSPLTREKLIELLHDSGWNKAEVARRVKLSRASIWKYMKKWDIPLQP